MLVLLITVPALGIAVFGSFELHRAEKTRLEEKAAAISRLAAAKEQNFIKATQQLLQTLIQFPVLLLSTNRNYSERNLVILKQLSPDYATFGLIETNGDVFCSAGPTNAPTYLGDRTYFRRVLETKRFSVGDFQVGRLTGEKVINFGQPVFNESGKLTRVLFASLKLKGLSEELADIMVPKGAVISVLDRSGNVLARNRNHEDWIGKNLADQPEVKRIIRSSGETFEMEGQDEIRRLYAVTVISNGDHPSLFVSVEIPRTTLFARANELLIGNLILLCLGAIALWFIIHFYLRRFFYRPMNVLSGAAMRLAGGDLTARTGQTEGSRELVQLGNALDDMAGNIERQTAELKDANSALRTEIEERQKTEQQLLRSQRTECIGAIAGGIAHDLNNALVPIMMGSEMLREVVGDKEESRTLLAMITNSAKRCSEMVKQVLSFSRGTGGEIGSVPIHQLIAEMAKIAKETFPKAITIESKVQRDLLSVQGNATELHQVLMNLCVNARDAMPEGGTLSIMAENAKSMPRIEPGTDSAVSPFVIIKIKDTGVGIPVEFRTRIFEPFFTTKAPGKGTGLGLSTVAAVVKRHKGLIELESEPDKGTEFKIYLPAIPVKVESESKSKTPLPSGHGELILLAEDEQVVLELAKTTLENYGYKVMTAANGLEAIACFEMQKDAIDLVMTDTDMPFLNGLSAVRAIRKLSPDMPILVASATKIDTDLFRREDLANLSTLPKPYGVEELLHAVATTLSKTAVKG